MTCGLPGTDDECFVDVDGNIVFCRLHGSAERLLKAAKWAARNYYIQPGRSQKHKEFCAAIAGAK